MKAELYTRPNCGYCIKAKQLLDAHDIEYEMVDLSQGDAETQTEVRARLIERVIAITGNQPTTMPQIFLDGGYIGGYDELKEYLDNSE